MIHRPLETIEDGRRGRGFILDPSCVGDKRVLAIDWNSVCGRAELIGVVMSLHRKPAQPCCPPFLGDGPDRFPMVRAHVGWGIGGAGACSFSAVVDVLNGTQIGVVAEALRVCIEYVVLGQLYDPADSDPDPDVTLPTKCCLPSYNIAVGSGYDVRSHNSNSARLTEFVVVEPGEEVCVPIPPFAISFTVQPIRGAAVSVDVVSDCGGTPVTYDIDTPLSNTKYGVENAVPLYNGARAIVVRNSSSTAPIKAFVIFGLAL